MPHWLGQTIYLSIYAMCVVGLFFWLKKFLWPLLHSLVAVPLFVGLNVVAFGLSLFSKIFAVPDWQAFRIKELEHTNAQLDKIIDEGNNHFFFNEALKKGQYGR